MTPLETALISAEVAARQCHQDDRLAESRAFYQQALACCRSASAQGQAPDPLRMAALLIALSGVLLELDRLPEGEQHLAEAHRLFDAVSQASADGRSLLDALRPSLHFEDAQQAMWSRRLADGIAHAQAGLARLGMGSPDPLLEARLRRVLGACLAMEGEVAPAAHQFQAALVLAKQTSSQFPPRDHARLLANLGNAYCSQGALADAERHMRQALAMFEGLLDAGRESAPVEIARTLMNLGSVLSNAGRFDEAVQCQRRAWAIYQGLLRRHVRHTAANRLRASCAMTEMNLGYTLLRLGDPLAAERHIRHALRQHAALAQSHPHLQEDLARILVNQAHVPALDGRWAQAARLYRRGLLLLKTQTAGGRRHLRADEANATLGLGRVYMAQGRVTEGGQCLVDGLATLSTLIEAGQLQHAQAWYSAWFAHCNNLVDKALDEISDATAKGRPRAPRRWAQAALTAQQALERAPMAALGTAPDPLQMLSQGLDHLARWQGLPLQAEAWLAALMDACFRLLLACLAGLMGDSDPRWLQQHSTSMQAAMARLYAFAVHRPKASSLLADWFFHTRGLRAQRSALAEGNGAPVMALRDWLSQLRRIEEEMLASKPGWLPESLPGGRASAAPAVNLHDPAATALAEQRAVAWLDLHQRCQGLRQQLVRDGLLPEALRLNAAMVATRMAPDAALVLLAQTPDDNLLVVSVRPARPGLPACSHRIMPLPDALADFPCRTLNLMARHALAAGANGRMLRSSPNGPAMADPPCPPGLARTDLDGYALHAFQSLWDAAVRPALLELVGQGYTELALAPSGDMHLVPWDHVLAASLPTSCRLSVYPNCGAWARQGLTPTPSEPSATHAPQWAIAAHAAHETDQALPWVAVELALTEQLWREAPAKVVRLDNMAPQAAGVNALLGMGHGHAPDHNLARAGLMLATDRVLCAHDLPSIKTCRRVLLSTCVLGQVDEVLGEALGFIAASFGYHTVFGIGWLTEAPDADACLFSLAYQFALARSVGPDGTHPSSWLGHFRQTQQAITNGHWPMGFGHWLAANLGVGLAALPASMPDRMKRPTPVDVGELARRPPPSLQRLAPWAIALGH